MKKIELQNFASFKSAEIDDLHPRINFIMGENGSGKSNFYKGIFQLIEPLSFCCPVLSSIQKTNVKS